MNQELIHYIFVYGTLKPGFINKYSDILANNSVVLGNGTISGKLYLIKYHDNEEFPAAVKDGSNLIHGVVLKITDLNIISIIDEYESYYPKNEKDSLFLRKPEEIQLYDGNSINAWVYWYNKIIINEELIKDGNYIIN